MEETISLQDIFTTLKKHMKLIVWTTIGAGLIAAIISFFLLTPIYKATSQILVNQKKEEVVTQITTADIQSNLQLINTYYAVLKSPAILNIVIEDMDLSMTASQLASKISVSSENNSQVLNVNVTDESYPVAADLANQIVRVFQEEVPQLMNVDNVNVLSPADSTLNAAPIKPNKMLNIAIAIVLGLMVGVGGAFLLEYLDKTIKTEQDIEDLLGLPVIGLVSPIEEKNALEQQVTQRRRVPSPKEKVGAN